MKIYLRFYRPNEIIIILLPEGSMLVVVRYLSHCDIVKFSWHILPSRHTGEYWTQGRGDNKSHLKLSCFISYITMWSERLANTSENVRERWEWAAMWMFVSIIVRVNHNSMIKVKTLILFPLPWHRSQLYPGHGAGHGHKSSTGRTIISNADQFEWPHWHGRQYIFGYTRIKLELTVEAVELELCGL